MESKPTGVTATLPPPAVTRKKSWRSALGAIGGPFVRLHHYRNIRTRMLHDALRIEECPPAAGRCGQPDTVE